MYTTDLDPNIKELKRLMPIVGSPRDVTGRTIKRLIPLKGRVNETNIDLIAIEFSNGSYYIFPGRLTLPYGVTFVWNELYANNMIHKKLWETRNEWRRKEIAPAAILELMVSLGLTYEDLEEALHEIS